jgi:hypothetical protein
MTQMIFWRFSSEGMSSPSWMMSTSVVAPTTANAFLTSADVAVG